MLLRGPSKDILNEVERNLHDALGVARNLALEPRLVPGGGAADMAVAAHLQQRAQSVTGVKQWPYAALAQALEVRARKGIFFIRKKKYMKKNYARFSPPIINPLLLPPPPSSLTGYPTHTGPELRRQHHPCAYRPAR